jgi:hypothetical protein
MLEKIAIPAQFILICVKCIVRMRRSGFILNRWTQVRFCGGDDYAGKASNITIQQLFNPSGDFAARLRRISWWEGDKFLGRSWSVETVTMAPVKGLQLVRKAKLDFGK